MGGVLVAPYVGAWIETPWLLNPMHIVRSHPTWVRGLKLLHRSRKHKRTGSHPTWVRGLKLADEDATLRVLVAPYVSAWIETFYI